MSIDRRLFLKRFGAGLGAISLGASIFPELASGNEHSQKWLELPAENAPEEDFWAWVQESYTVSPNIINLNNGGVSPQPKIVQDTFER